MQVVQYKCPNCSGDITYSAETGKFSCEYCGSSFTFDEVAKSHRKNENIDLSDTGNQEQTDEFTKLGALYQCPSCGSEIIAENSNTLTLNCYYCHSPVTLVGRLSGEYKPDYIIPFSVTREEAEKKFLQFCEDKPYLPEDFNDSKTLEKITGVYVPFWLGNYAFNTSMVARCQKRKRISDNRTRIKEYDTKRSAVIYYENVPADGSKLIDDTLMDAIQPYDFSKLQKFSMSYLSGFMAEKYDIAGEEALQRQYDAASANTKDIIVHDLKKSYSNVAPMQMAVEPQFSDKKYALLPVWFLAYRYNDKVYQYGVNGQTGTLSGSIPIDDKKLTRHSWLYGIIGGVLGVALALFVYVFLFS